MRCAGPTSWASQSPRISRAICGGRCRRRFGRSWAKTLAKKGKFVVLVNEALTPNRLASLHASKARLGRRAGTLPRLFRRHHVCGLPIHGDMPRLPLHPLEQRADLGKAREIEIAGMREVRVGIKRDIGDGVAVGHEVTVVFEVMLHHGERAVSFFDTVLERVLLQLAATFDQREPEIGGTHIGLNAVMLEEHPLQLFGAIHSMLGTYLPAAD